MTSRLLLCTDLDRTLLPNGLQPESPGARSLFARVVQRPEVELAYVTGRHLALVLEAIDEYALPLPDYILGDVGTCIYAAGEGKWESIEAWARQIDTDWAPHSRDDLSKVLVGMPGLRLQEDAKQNTHKLSFYVDPGPGVETLMNEAKILLDGLGVKTSLIWSIDETTGTGLLDVLPASASKLGAVRFLIGHSGHDLQNTVFAGDSGNDLPVLCSEINSVLVANATPEVKEEATRLAADSGNSASLYLAKGGLMPLEDSPDDNLNGNYSAGILEGLLHYRPEVKAWLQ